MAIRDRFRRALRKSDSSDTISQTDSNSSTASSTRQSSSSEVTTSSQIQPSPTTKISRTFTFGHRDKKEKESAKAKAAAEKQKRKPVKPWMHPSEKPLTAQNLKHQEMFSQFTMTFGTRKMSQLSDLEYDGVSPCCTRPCSIDGGSR